MKKSHSFAWKAKHWQWQQSIIVLPALFSAVDVCILIELTSMVSACTANTNTSHSMTLNTGFHKTGVKNSSEWMHRVALCFSCNSSCNIMHTEIRGCRRRQPQKATNAQSSEPTPDWLQDRAQRVYHGGHSFFSLRPPHVGLNKKETYAPNSLSMLSVSTLTPTHETICPPAFLSIPQHTAQGVIGSNCTWTCTDRRSDVNKFPLGVSL